MKTIRMEGNEIILNRVDKVSLQPMILWSSLHVISLHLHENNRIQNNIIQ